MSYTDDPVMDYINHDKEQSRWLLSRPVCSICREPIQDDTVFVIGEKNYCEECMRDEFARDIPDDGWDEDDRDYGPPDDDDRGYDDYDDGEAY